MKILIALIVAALVAGGTVAGLVAANPSSDITNGPANAVIVGAAQPAAGDSCCPPPGDGAAPAVAHDDKLTEQESLIAANLVTQAALQVEADPSPTTQQPSEQAVEESGEKAQEKAAGCTSCSGCAAE